MSINIWYFYYAKTSRSIYPLKVIAYRTEADVLVFDYERVTGLCKTGCSNYDRNGGCPPKAPRYDSITSPKQTGILIWCKFFSCFNPPQVAKSNNIAIHWRFQDGILARFLNNVGWSMVERYGGFFLSSGYCMGCPGKKCGFKTNAAHCLNPKKRTFSLEATGIDVAKSIWKIAREKLHWYKKGDVNVPYMLKCICFFPSSKVSFELDSFKETLNNLSSCWVEIDSQAYLEQKVMLQKLFTR